MNKMQIARTATKITVGFSTSFAVGNIIKNNVLPATRLQQVEIWVAATVVGSMVAMHAEKYADMQLVKIVESVQKHIDEQNNPS